MRLLYLEYLSEIPADLNLKNGLRWNCRALPFRFFNTPASMESTVKLWWEKASTVSCFKIPLYRYRRTGTDGLCDRWVEFSCGWRAWVCSQVLARGIAICSLSSHWLCHTSVSFHCFPRSQFVGATGKSTSFHRWLQVASKSLNQELGKCFDGIEQRASTSDDERCGKRWKEVECSGWQSSSTIYQGRRTWMSTIGLFIVQLNYTAFACAVHVLPLYAIHMSQWQVNYVNLICATTILGWTEHVCTLAKSKFWASIISKLRCTPMFFLFLLISMLKESRKTHWGNFADWYFAYPTSLKLLRAAVTWIWNQIEVDGDTISWLCLLIQPVGMRVT